MQLHVSTDTLACIKRFQSSDYCTKSQNTLQHAIAPPTSSSQHSLDYCLHRQAGHTQWAAIKSKQHSLDCIACLHTVASDSRLHCQKLERD